MIKIAAHHGIPLHPVSRGKNWGYGDACPTGPAQAVLDLSRMNRIVEVDSNLAYCVIEPGISQIELFRYLREHHPDLWIDATGAGLDSSFVGNTLDRGFGHTRYGDHFLSACGMEVVLADGRVLNTGFGHYPNAKAARVYRYGVGPFLDGLFAQSNFGIVTKIGVWLMPKPQDFCAFFCLAERDEELEDIIDRLAPLRLQGLLQSTIHIGNDLRVFSSRARFPFDLTGGKTPLPADVRRQLRERYAVGYWNLGGAIYGTRGTVAATRKAVAKALRPYGPVFLNDKRLALAEKAIGFASRFGMMKGLAERLESVKPVYGLLKGIPSNEPLRGAAWRVRDPDPQAPADPLDCHAGLMWVSPVLPTRGSNARELLTILEPIYARHGFDPLVTFTMITERAMTCVTNISFDKRLPDEAAAAKRCYDELFDALLRTGYIPYRAGPSGMRKLSAEPDVFWDVASDIKRVLDPDNLISPGRYVPTPRPEK